MIRGIFEKQFLNKKVEIYSVFYMKKPFHVKGILRQNTIPFENGDEYFDKTYKIDHSNITFKISHIGKLICNGKCYYPNGKITFDADYWKKMK